VNFSVATTGGYSSSEFSATIGQGIMHRYRVIYDYSRRQMIFEPNAESTAAFPERRSFGMTLLSSGPHYKTFTVSAVRAGSPADKAGFRTNDIITSIDGRPATALTLGDVRADFANDGRSLMVTVARGGETVNLPTTVSLISLDR
jgi:S1-C subfamily serine protease